MTTRVAVLPGYFNWRGGLDFLRNIVGGLLSVHESHDVKIYIAIDEALRQSELYTSCKDYFSQFSEGRICEIDYLSYEVDLRDKLQEHLIDIILPVNADLGVNFPIPWVSYIPDFQHKYLYKNFSEHECFSRETAYAARLRDCRAMLVNSEAVRADILKFYPWTDSSRIFSLPYTPQVTSDWLAVEPKPVQKKYDIASRYFMICNQFWKHKDHKTAFRAFSMLQDRSVELVCTGALEDYRDPHYIASIKKLLLELNISDRVKLVGHIPKLDQVGLLKGSLALIQPTLFEGGPGGGAVYDAVSLGVPVVLSDIEINKEVSAGRLNYFKAECVNSLVVQLEKALQKHPNIEPNELLARGQENQRILGDKLLRIISYTLSRYAQDDTRDC